MGVSDDPEGKAKVSRAITLISDRIQLCGAKL